VWAVARPGSETCKTNPIWPRRKVNAQNEPNPGHPGKMSGGDAQPTKSEECKTNQIWPRRGWAPETKRAKRSQTWVDWGMWEKVVFVWDVARPGSETCKTNPIWGPGPHDCGLEIADWKDAARDGVRAKRTQLGGLVQSLRARQRGFVVGTEGVSRERLTASLPTPAPPARADATWLRTREGDLQGIGVSCRPWLKVARISASLAVWRGEGLFGSARAWSLTFSRAS
jgi:hypothetical protein